MAHSIACYRCGESLAALTLPLSRRDQCPACHVYLHVCRMCRHFDRGVAGQCREDDADDVTDKEIVNFCDYFEPSADAFDASRKADADAARAALDGLFGNGEAEAPESGTSPADDLFK